jgi:hypothetical protein
MASNFACESVQRSAGTAPKYLYAPAPEGTAEMFGGITTVINVATVSGTPLPIVSLFPAGSNGIFLIDCSTSNAVYNISSSGIVLDVPGASVTVIGFNNVNTAPGGLTEVGLSGGSGALALYQNSGGALTYTLNISKIASVQIA